MLDYPTVSSLYGGVELVAELPQVTPSNSVGSLRSSTGSLFLVSNPEFRDPCVEQNLDLLNFSAFAKLRLLGFRKIATLPLSRQ
jgi:hypothetical protein